MKRKLFIPVLAAMFAFGGAVTTHAMKSGATLASVEYKNSSNQCVTNNDCSTTTASIVCSGMFVSGSNCLTPVAAYRK